MWLSLPTTAIKVVTFLLDFFFFFLLPEVISFLLEAFSSLSQESTLNLLTIKLY